jgi:hypothetical protein
VTTAAVGWPSRLRSAARWMSMARAILLECSMLSKPSAKHGTWLRRRLMQPGQAMLAKEAMEGVG